MTDLRENPTAVIAEPVAPARKRFNLAETDAAASASARTDRPTTDAEIAILSAAARAAAKRALPVERLDLGLTGASASSSSSGGCCGGGCCS
ncbi:MAG: hypothetical protein H7146_01830 [Burkholderiaceae bacterium]|nr:hypothetical protein [Microbacteriaceae bacterium]